MVNKYPRNKIFLQIRHQDALVGKLSYHNLNNLCKIYFKVILMNKFQMDKTL